MASQRPDQILADFDEPDVPVPRSRKTPKSESPASTATGATRIRRNRGSGAKQGAASADRFHSFQAAVVESMEETQRLRRSKGGKNGDLGANVLMDTVKEITTAASGTYASIRDWANQTGTNRSVPSSQSYELDERNSFPISSKSGTLLVGANGNSLVCGTPHSEPGVGHINRFASQGALRKHSIIQDLAWPFAVCGIDVSENLPKQAELAPHIQKMRDAVTKAVNGDMGTANDIWKFAAPSRDDDENTQFSLDTLQEENNQIRRLGSWGTVGTAGTAGTSDTDAVSLDQPKTPLEIRFGLEDDDGNAIDPLLFEKAQKSREKRKPRRKLVKFDYPPIKSLRQCPRPDPKDLPDLFFTEHELDQIEDDRYSTMSTDDIEIVAVASKTGETSKTVKAAKPKRGAAFHGPLDIANQNSSNAREQPEHGFRQVKGRPSTPHRRRNVDDEEDPEISASEPKSPENGGRLVKGVQIYLRERSTGA